MTESVDTWITDTEISTRFPYYTRANADEVGPEPFSPLGWSLGWAKGCVPGVANGYCAFGVLEPEEYAVDPPEVFGNWGGYFYNQLSLPRVMGVRMPGASPAAIDLAYFGDRPGVPKYTPHPDDENEAASRKLAESMAWAMSTAEFPAQEEASRYALDVVRDRPDLSAMSNADLVARARQLAGPDLDWAWTAYCQSALAASLGPGAVQAICEAIGRGDDAVKVMTAIGGVESADAGVVMWELSRRVKDSPFLMDEFDAGVDGLLDRLTASGNDDAVGFLDAWADLIAVHGHRGPNEWDLRAHSWTTKPSLALGMLERMRHQDDAKSPGDAHVRGVAERERLTAELLEIVAGDPEAHGGLHAGIASAAVFYGMREMGKNACIRLIHEAKLALTEVGARCVADGVLDDPQQIFMLLDDEVDGFLVDPASMVATIRERETTFALLQTLEPPYIVKLEEGVPPISTWAKRGGGVASVASPGEVLQGTMGSPGVVTGTARVILDPSDPGAIGPGDIMVAPTTDPSWVPLFLAAEGVVVDVGAVASHAAIMCRELGLPCAVSVVDATKRIPDGATIEIDGSTGSVKVVEVPG
ncbi:PEP-utilizing enzyme [Ilumatobacter nonamiensis]|uniref:PEP-utilizing enzyme n=1 Tax=Ilumatobacter nonamiensis TaxID=467093 RepID=UPI000349F721|nr:PEP-utilizing enzyme [Ilumatobacter nonamiensis]